MNNISLRKGKVKMCKSDFPQKKLKHSRKTFQFYSKPTPHGYVLKQPGISGLFCL